MFILSAIWDSLFTSMPLHTLFLLPGVLLPLSFLFLYKVSTDGYLLDMCVPDSWCKLSLGLSVPP